MTVTGSPVSGPVRDTFMHLAINGYSPGHVHRFPIPNDNLIRNAGSSGSSTGSITPPLASISGMFYRINFRVRGVCELIPWFDDGSAIIFNPGDVVSYGWAFMLMGNAQRFIAERWTFNRLSDSLKPPLIDTTRFGSAGIILNNTSEGTGSSPLGSAFVDRIVSVSVPSNAVGTFTGLVGISTWDQIATSEGYAAAGLYSVGTAPDGQSNFTTLAALGTSLGVGNFFTNEQSLNPPGLVYPHAPMMIPTVPLSNQLRVQVMFAGATLEPTARREEYFDI